MILSDFLNRNFLFRILSAIVIIPLAFLLLFLGSYYSAIFIFICYLIMIYEWTHITQEIDKKLTYLFFGFIYITISTFQFYILANVSTVVIYFVIITVILFDSFSYFFGKIIQGPKIAKTISPSKTWSGFLFGIFATLISVHLLYLVTSSKFIISDENSFIHEFIFYWTFFICILSFFGDLLISFAKRRGKVKDSGKIIPGHGGLLDRVDGLLFIFFVITFFQVYKFYAA